MSTVSSPKHTIISSVLFDSDDFSVKQFIDGLVMQTSPVTIEEHHKSVNSPTSDHDDLLPFITTFETALQELTKLRDDVAERVAVLDKELREEESISLAITSMADNLESTFRQADKLEDAFDRLEHEPLETGKHLHRLQQQKQRSDHAYQVLIHLDLFKHSDSDQSLLADINKGGEGAKEGAKIVHSLYSISEALDESDPIAQNICKFVETVIVRLQGDFKEALSLNNKEKMSELYELLRILGKDEECRSLFVQSHSLLTMVNINIRSIRSLYHIDVTSSTDQPPKQQIVIRVGRDEPHEPLITDSLQRLWNSCADGDNYGNIVDVFGDDSDLVISELIGGFVDSQLRPLVTECLRQAKQHSLLARQRQLNSIFRLFTDFCARFEDNDTQNSIADAIDSLLQPYLQSIVNDEKQCNEDLLRALMSNYNAAVARKRSEQKRSIISSPLASPSVSTTKAHQALLQSSSLLFPDGRPLILSDGTDFLDIDVVQRALVLTAEAAGRVISVVGTSTAEHILPSLLTQLVTIVFPFDIVDVVCQASEPPKYGFEASHFSLVQSVHTALTALQLWFERHYGVLAAAVSAGCYAECVRIKSEAMRSAEQRQQRLMNTTLNWIVSFVGEYYFKQQKKADYHPLSQQPANMQQHDDTRGLEATQYCRQLCLFTKRVASAMRERVEDAIADPWLYHLALRLLHTIMHDLVKRTVVSELGAVTLLRDAQFMSSCIPRDTLPNNTHLASLYVACLKDLARIYMVRLEAVRAAVQEGGLASVDLKLILPFVASRADVKVTPRLMNKYFADYHTSM